jgi:hypothetical protein
MIYNGEKSSSLNRLSRQNEMIQNATRTVAETEEVGLEITQELARNREKIESSRARVRLGVETEFFN